MRSDEELGRIAYEAYMSPIPRDGRDILQWTHDDPLMTLRDGSKAHWIRVAAAVCAAVLGEGETVGAEELRKIALGIRIDCYKAIDEGSEEYADKLDAIARRLEPATTAPAADQGEGTG